MTAQVNAQVSAQVLVLELAADDDPECPDECGGWKFISFNSRHINSEDAHDYATHLDASGKPVPTSIGLRRRLTCGTAFWVSCYEHGGCVLSLAGEGMQCQWDTTRYAGILLWQDAASDLPKGYEKRRESARRFLEVYTQWANGEVYGYDLETREGEHIDSCWGFYDTKQMFAEIRVALPLGAKVIVEGDCAWLAQYAELPIYDEEDDE